MSEPVIAAEPPFPDERTIFTHENALDGDENLYVGKRVLLDYGTETVPAVVDAADDRGYWYFRVEP